MIMIFYEILVRCFKLFSRVKSTQDEKVHFIKGIELKLIEMELLLFFYFKNITYCCYLHLNSTVVYTICIKHHFWLWSDYEWFAIK